jgi:hypothetical protein
MKEMVLALVVRDEGGGNRGVGRGSSGLWCNDRCHEQDLQRIVGATIENRLAVA